MAVSVAREAAPSREVSDYAARVGLSPWSEALRASVLADAAPYSERLLLVAESFRSSEGEPWRELRWARAIEHMLAHCPVSIRRGELLAGRHPSSHPDEDVRTRIAEAADYLRREAYWVAASEGHMALGYPRILAAGLDAILDDIRARADALPPLEPHTPERCVFYSAAEVGLRALQHYVERYADLASDLAAAEGPHGGNRAELGGPLTGPRIPPAGTPVPPWRAELEAVAGICRHIAHQAPRTFREAMQLMWFCFLGVALEAGESHHCFGPGRMDQYLLPFLERDREAGRLDEELVDDLLDQLFIKCNEFGGREMSALILGIGGRRPDGGDATNELSWRCLDASRRTRMYFPGMDVFWHGDMPPAFVRHACALLANGNGQPSFFNDDLIIRGLERYGIPYEHAVDHLPSTCTETSIMGRSNPWVAWPYMNLALSFLAALFGGVRPDTGAPCGPATPMPQDWDELLDAVWVHLRATAEEAVAAGIRDQATAAQARPFPLLSCFIEGCVESGRNISHGGALYSFLQPEAVGVANVVDSLAAIRTLVRDTGRYSLDDFRAAMRANWEGWDELQRAVRRDCPKYGNDDEWVNDLFARVAGTWCDAIEGHLNHYGGPVFPGFLGWVVWIGFGEQTPATPDGRLAGEPLANSLAPRSGVALRGTASSVLSAARFDHSRGLGGIVYNIRFSGAALAAPDGPDRLRALVGTALGDAGLYMVQVEITSSETLRAAQREPDTYRDLFVRIGGYLVPFTLLPPSAQEEVIQRTELDL